MAECKEDTLGRFWTPSRRRFALAGLVALYLAGISGHWYITSDSAHYLMLGRNLSEGRGYTLFDQPHGKFPPGFPLWIAGMTRLGLGEMLWLNASMVAAGLATLWMSYRLLCRMAPEPLALTLTLALGLGYEMFLNSVRQLSDVPFMLLVTAGLWAYVRVSTRSQSATEPPGIPVADQPPRSAGSEAVLQPRDVVWLLCGTAALVASCWVRIVGLPLAVAAGAALVLERRRIPRRWSLANLAVLFAGLATTTASLYALDQWARQELNTASYNAEMDKLAARTPLEVMAGPLVNVYRTGPELFRLFSGQEMPAPLALLLFVPLVIGMTRYARSGHWTGMAAVVGYTAAILFLRPMLVRYLLPVAPLLLLYTVTGLRYLATVRFPVPARARIVGLAAMCLVALSSLPKDLRLVAALHSSRFRQFRADWPETYAAADYLRQRSGQMRRFVATGSEEVLTYLSGVPCLRVDRTLVMASPPVAEVAAELSRHGVDVVMIKKGLPKYPFDTQLVALARGDGSLLFENGLYEVYALTPPPRMATRFPQSPGPATTDEHHSEATSDPGEHSAPLPAESPKTRTVDR